MAAVAATVKGTRTRVTHMSASLATSSRCSREGWDTWPYKCSSTMSCTLVKRLRVRLTVSPAGASTEMTELALELARESSEATLDTEDVLESELDASENIAAENEGWDVAWRVGGKARRGSTRRIFIKHLPFGAVHQHTPVHNVASVTCSRLVTSARDIHGLLNVRQSTLASSLGSMFLPCFRSASRIQ